MNLGVQLNKLNLKPGDVVICRIDGGCTDPHDKLVREQFTASFTASIAGLRKLGAFPESVSFIIMSKDDTLEKLSKAQTKIIMERILKAE